MVRFIFLLVFCFSIEVSYGQTITHPTEENINPEFGITFEINNSDTSFKELPNAEKSLIERIKNHTILFKIGKRQGQASEMLGKVMDTHIDEKNSMIFIIDAQNIGVLTFDLEGNYLQKISQKGRGPGELLNPFSTKSSSSDLFVLDRRYNVKKFSVDGTNFAFQNSVNTKFRPESFCLNSGKLIIKAMSVTDPSSISNRNNIYTYDLDEPNEPVNEYGELYISDSWFAVMHMSLGGIECTPESPTVVQYFEYLNLLYGFDQNGELIWITKINNFNFLELIETPNGSLGPDRSKLPINFDSIYHTASVNKDYFIVQVATRTISSEGYAINGIKTFLLNYQDGSGRLISETLPAILSISESRIAFLTEKDFPQVVIAQY